MRFLWEDLLHFSWIKICPVFLESKLENSDKVASLFGNHQGVNDVNYEAVFQKRKQAPMTESNPSSNLKLHRLEQEKRQISLQVIRNILKDLLRIRIVI